MLFFCERFRVVFYGVVALYAVSFAAFTWTYFGRYVDDVGPKFFPGLIEAVRAASANPDDRVCVTGQVMFPYIYVLLANQEDPREFLKTRRFLDPEAEFMLVTSFGRYEFGVPQVDRPDIDVFVFYPTDAWFSPEQFSIEKFGDFDVVRRRK